MIVQFGSGAELVFLLTDSTQASQVGGFFKARRNKDNDVKRYAHYLEPHALQHRFVRRLEAGEVGLGRDKQEKDHHVG